MLIGVARDIGSSEADCLHIGAGHAPSLAASNIPTVVSTCRPGAIVVVDDIHVEAIRRPADALVSEGLIRLKDDLHNHEVACYEVVSAVAIGSAQELESRIANLLARPT